MHIKSIQIKNFKSFENIIIHLNSDLNIFTGVNNSGKTTLLEAIALWNECFRKLINQAKRSATNYKSGDFVFGPTNNKYFEFDEINSVRSPYFEDIFRDRNKKNKVSIIATLEHKEKSINIGFKIGDSTGRYIIELINHSSFNYREFNIFFKNLPDAISTYYASPVSFIKTYEDFTLPTKIEDSINKRESSSFMRNRIYRLRTDNSSEGISRYQNFEKDLSYILYNNYTAKLLLNTNSDIHRDTRVKINYQIGNRDYEKDIALLGSGTLQIIEILLNVYQQNNSINKDLNLILLDEPDSHIHRDIQKRLVSKLVDFGNNNQIFITTHNESLIRSSNLKNLFHIDTNTNGEIHNLYSKDLNKTEIPHFKGLFPNQISPVIKSIGANDGLDFINAIEADKIIFVEGEDDARVINRLLQEIHGNDQRKFMFWVLGGVSKVFSKINSYKLFFSEIKNEKTLWEKSFLIIDKDNLTDSDSEEISKLMKEKLDLPNFILPSYTFESILFKDINKLAQLLVLKYEIDYIKINIDEIKNKLETNYLNYKDILFERYHDEEIDKSSGFPSYKDYRGRYITPSQNMFDSFIKIEDVPLSNKLKKYYKQTIQNKDFFKLMNKTDVENIINQSLSEYSITFDIESDFYTLVQLINTSTWYEEFNFLQQI